MKINSVSASFNVGCHLDLHKLAHVMKNVYHKYRSSTMKVQFRSPKSHFTIQNTGKIFQAGAQNEASAMKAARRLARILQNFYPKVQVRSYTVCSIMASESLPFGVNIERVTESFPTEISYEPELVPGIIWRTSGPLGGKKVCLKVYTSGAMVLLGAKNASDALAVLEWAGNILKNFQRMETKCTQVAMEHDYAKKK